MELIYNIKDKPPVGKLIMFAFQQLLAVLAGTITLPLIVGNGMSQSAALLGAGVGTLIYLLITKFRSPVFLGSSFTYLGSMVAAFAGAATAAIGFVGVLLGAVLAGLVYVILSIIVHFTGSGWVNKVMPPIIIGPVVAVIALSLSPNAIENITKGDVFAEGATAPLASPYICLLCGLVALVVIIICAVYGKKMIKYIPFIIGILAGYGLALVFTLIGNATNVDALKIINFTPFIDMKWIPDFTFIRAFQGIKDFGDKQNFLEYFGLIAIAYVPVALAVFAEHIADHKNISFIINKNLLEDPGLPRTLMGDGVGSMVGAFFGGCPNTTYGESISCIAFSKNASVITIVVSSCMAIVLSFFGPLMAFFASIPSCVVGGISIALYGFIAASGLQMLKDVDMTKLKHIFVIATILVVGIGGLVIRVSYFVFSPIATAFATGVLVNLLVNIKPRNKKEPPQSGGPETNEQESASETLDK